MVKKFKMMENYREHTLVFYTSRGVPINFVKGTETTVSDEFADELRKDKRFEEVSLFKKVKEVAKKKTSKKKKSKK